MRFLTLGLTLFLLLLVAGSAQAVQTMDPVPQPDASDWFVEHGDWWFVHLVSGVSSVDCALVNGCWGCMRNAYGKRICAYGLSSGGCNCADIQREGAGAGITDCRLLNGTCKERLNP